MMLFEFLHYLPSARSSRRVVIVAMSGDQERIHSEDALEVLNDDRVLQIYDPPTSGRA